MNTLGPRVYVADIISILGSQYAEQYCGVLDVLGITRTELPQSQLPSNKIEIVQFAGLAAEPDGDGVADVADKDYTLTTPPPSAYVKTVSESVTLRAKTLRFVDDKEILTGFVNGAGSVAADPFLFIRQAVADKFLSKMEDDLFTTVANAGTGRKVSYTSQATGNAFTFKELKNAAIALSGRYAQRDRYTLICHPNVYAAMFDTDIPDLFKVTNLANVTNALVSTGLQFLQVHINDKCPYNQQTELYTSYLVVNGAVNYYVHTWEVDLNPYGFDTYQVYLRPARFTIDSQYGHPVWFFEAKWAFHVPKLDRPRICEFKCKATDIA